MTWDFTWSEITVIDWILQGELEAGQDSPLNCSDIMSDIYIWISTINKPLMYYKLVDNIIQLLALNRLNIDTTYLSGIYLSDLISKSIDFNIYL